MAFHTFKAATAGANVASWFPDVRGPTLVRVSACAVVALLTANCAAPTQQTRQSRSKEIGAFSDPKYGRASPRVVADGESVPKGGGRFQVGRSYSVAGRRYTPREDPGYSSSGLASWYGEAFHGRKTANGEVYDRHALSAAHPTMPLPSYARVTNTANNRSIVVRVNDRGPFHANRLIDVSQKVAEVLQFRHIGTARVKVDYLRRAGLAGSDDRILMSSLRTDGALAQLPGDTTPGGGIMLAGNDTSPGIGSSRNDVIMPRAQPVVSSTVVAMAEPTPVPASAAPATIERDTARRVALPLPPDRPFDLGVNGQRPPVLVAAAIPAPLPQSLGVRSAPPPTVAAASVEPQRLALASTQTLSVENGSGRLRAPVTVDPAGGPRQIAALYFAAPDGPVSAFAEDDPFRQVRGTGGFSSAKPLRVHQAASMVLQVGVFRDKANADRIVRLLSPFGVSSVRMIGQSYQVSVASFADEGRAADALGRAREAGARDARLIKLP
jgi:rare lipoprotein A